MSYLARIGKVMFKKSVLLLLTTKQAVLNRMSNG